ncbi:phosphoadenosine phosphosulfate reductase [Gemmobacter serpentinus]|uniref:phosphoadenosine phosphosulfate reductase n=1 Tax=Gemmobacter serpentinus TaxID=2652247 RepID=UPI00124C6C47|nr:phosphoadenosine phosphosulfate reductase [Gemmobacter serpentinus]
MSETVQTAAPPSRYDASMAADHASWLARLDEICADEGYFEPLGARHHAFFADEGPTLIVSFETVEQVRARKDQMPFALSVAAPRGWSQLCILSEGETWYRDPAVYRYFDRLVDDAFFEDFDRVLFYGAGMGGYAACAFSVCAPGATVLAAAPRATQDPAVAGWDRRTLDARRLNFTDRFGFAPDMVEGTGEVFILHDPRDVMDAMHAALFTRPFVTQLRTPFLGARPDQALDAMGLLPGLLADAAEGRLSATRFARLWRSRRSFGPWLRAMLTHVEAQGSLRRALGICRSVNARLQAPRFRRRQTEIEAQLGGKG